MFYSDVEIAFLKLETHLQTNWSGLSQNEGLCR